LPRAVTLFTLTFLVSSGAARGEDPLGEARKARVSLVVRDRTAQPGRTTRIAIRFEMEPGWHVYWRNPGDSGLPPAVEWKLPDGFSVSDPLWPAPRRLPADPLVMYGYEGTFLLAFDVSTPKDFRGRAELAAHDVALALDVTKSKPEPDPRWRAAFARHAELLPAPAPKGALRAEAGDDGLVRLALRRAAAGKPKLLADPKPEFFPGVEGVLKNAAPRRGRRKDGDVFVTLTPADSVPERLAGVLAVVTVEGRRAWRVDVPVEKTTKERNR